MGEFSVDVQLGASVTTGRSAVIQLEPDTLITRGSPTTANTTALSHEEITQTIAARHNMERLSITKAARRATPAVVRHFAGLLEFGIESRTRKGSQFYVQLDFVCHQAS